MMRFLVDNSLSSRLAGMLQAAGHDCIHAREIGLADAADEAIFDRAASDARVVIAQDTDFGTLLAMRRTGKPSVILFRCEKKATESLGHLLITHLSAIQADLESGAVVVFEDTRIRVRRLPING